MSEDKGGEDTKRLSQELKSSLYQRGQEGGLWDGHMTPGDLQEVLGHADPVYGQGPPSVASGPRNYTHPGYDGLPVEEMQGMDMGQQHFEDMPPAPPQDNNQVAAWYDTDL